jgi:hypothetical protein
MPRMSIAENYWRHNVKGEEKDENEYSTWIVLYRFKERPNSRFWKNLEILTERDEKLTTWRNSVFTENERGALAVASLVEHYGGEFKAFRGNQVDLSERPSLKIG